MLNLASAYNGPKREHHWSPATLSIPFAMWQFQNASKTVTAIFRRRAKKAHPMLNLILWLYNWHGYFGRISRRMCDFFKLFKSIGHIDFWGVPDRWTRCRWAIVQRHPKVSRDVQRYLGESVQRYLMKYVFQKHIFMLNIHQGLHQEKTPLYESAQHLGYFTVCYPRQRRLRSEEALLETFVCSRSFLKLH